ncbi:sensor histidine kinase [Paenibacillaceae bacterium WGS1546]|uniref:sensor histidine kinase n=1 Tax=Cohnella sp. WGS1546 TaxID=3366810 RepID=UPI00372D6EBB
MSWIKKSLFAKLLVGMLAASVIPFFVSNLISYQSNIASVKQQFIELNQHSMRISMNQVRKYFGELSTLAVSYYSDSDLIDMMQSTASNPYASVYISEQMQKMYASHLEIKSINYTSVITGQSYTLNNNTSINRSSESRISATDFDEWDMTKEFEVFSLGAADRTLVLRKPIIDYPGSNVLGVSSLYVGLDEISEMVSEIADSSEGNSEFLLIHRHPQLLFSSQDVLEENDEDQLVSMVTLFQGNSGTLNGGWSGEKGTFIYLTDSFRGMPLTVIRFVPESAINEAANQTLSRSLIVQFIAIGFILVLAVLLSYYLIRRIKRIIRNIAKVQTGAFDVEEAIGGADELGILEDRFRKMVQQLDVLINQEYRNQLELSTARLKMLQSQINPHFLYNTLQSIGTLALGYGVREISDKISELGDIFRYSMDIKTEIVPLRTELRHIETYLSLQRGRFTNNLSFTISCDERLLNIRVPKLILQPLVENSIVHGIEKGRGNGIVHIRIEHGENIHMRIIDNGKGMDESNIEKIEEGYRQYQLKSDTSIGLLNVLHRLQLFYGKGFDWDIESTPYEMTIVSLHIPFPTSGEEES